MPITLTGSSKHMGEWFSHLQYATTLMSCDHKHCHSGDIIFLICHVSSREHIVKGLYKFMGGSPTLCGL